MNETRMRDALLASEQPSTELERRYRERLSTILERRITTKDRVGLVIGLLGAVATAVWFVRLLGSPPPACGPIGVIALKWGLVMCAGWAAYAIAFLLRGTENLGRDRPILVNLVVVSAVVPIALLFWKAVHLTDTALGNQKLLVALLVWTMGVLPFCVAHLVRESGLQLRADLLRLELALAELGERKSASPQE